MSAHPESQPLTPVERASDMRWFAVIVPSAHTPTRTPETHPVFVYARDAVDALRQTQTLRGWKRSRIPDGIFELSEEGAFALESIIDRTPSISLDGAKHLGFYGRRKDWREYDIEEAGVELMKTERFLA